MIIVRCHGAHCPRCPRGERVRVQGDGGGPSEALLWRLKGKKKLRLACADRAALESRYWKLEENVDCGYSGFLAAGNCQLQLQLIGRRADLSPITCDALDAYPSLTKMHISREDEEREHKLACQIAYMLMLQCQQLYLYVPNW